VSGNVALNISKCGERHRPFNYTICMHNQIGELLSQE